MESIDPITARDHETRKPDQLRKPGGHARDLDTADYRVTGIG
jgi:hypothetical protein